MYSNSVIKRTVHSTVYENSTWIQSCQFRVAVPRHSV